MASDIFQRSITRNLLLILVLLLGILAGILIVLGHLLAATLSVIFCFLVILSLIRIFNSTNNAVSAFFDSLGNDDTTIHFSKVKGNASLKKLYGSMEKLNRHFQEIRLKNEYNESFYRTLIEFASTGLVVLDESNSIVLINKVACNYAGISPDSTNRNLLKIRHPEFYKAICNLFPGDNIIYRHLVSNELQMLSFRAAKISRNDQHLKLVSVNDIRSELENRELESYRKLMNVMTHEIMNLLSPITSVSGEIYSQLIKHRNNRSADINEEPEVMNKALTGLQMINEQSDGILNFVNNYRKISRIPQPAFSSFDASEWTSQIMIVYSGKMRENEIDFRISIERNVHKIIADRNLLNQVIINIINNAIDAVIEIEGERKILVNISKKSDERILISISNNGPRIPYDLIEKIFVPFFTTKKNGSGIGLSISQEIIKLHKGSILVTSSENGLTNFHVEL